MATYEIPLQSGPQILTVDIDGVQYSIRLHYANSADAGWIMDITRAAEGVALLAGIPLVTGADLLGQHAHLGINGALYASVDGSELAPSFDDIGRAGRLFLVTP